MISDLIFYSVFPFIGALLIPFLSKEENKFAEIITNIFLLFGLLNLIYLIILLFKNEYLIYNYDGFSVLMLFIIYLVSLCISFFLSISDKVLNKKSFYPLILISVSSMSSIVIANDFFTIYIFMEILSITSFTLIASKDDKESIEASLKYFLLTFPASALIIIGISILLITNGTIYFNIFNSPLNQLNILALIIIILGFLIKSGIFPFHFWTPDAYQASPSTISAYLAGIVTKISGMYIIIRICISLKNSNINTNIISETLMFLGLITLIIGSILALKQKNLKRMLSYSSISQMGYILLGAGTLSGIGIIGSIFHIFNHSTFKTILFLNASTIEKTSKTLNMNEIKGLEKNMPFTSYSNMIALFATSGVPPLSGFWSKFLIILSLWFIKAKIYAGLALIFSIVTLAYFMILQKKVFFGKAQEENKEIKEGSFFMLLPILIMSLIIIFSGIFFPYVFKYLTKTIIL